MVLAEDTKFILCILVVLLLLKRPWAAGAETHSLSYDFTITPKLRPRHWWCEVEGQVNKTVFLHYDCGNKVKPFGPLGKEINATNTWEEQTETLRDVVDVLTQQLTGLQLESYTLNDPLTLQATMSCHREANGHSTGSWQFGFDGQKFLLFDSEKRKWTLLHPGGRQMKEKWEHDRDVTMFFQKTSVGDCTRWLEDFWMCWKKSLQPTAPPTEDPGTSQPTARATRAISWSLPALLTIFILLAILGQCLLTSAVGRIGGEQGKW
ncbi:UL16-binding protein 1-like [Nycticebus coucang]|uniref:UL16-binding protein 1-like n=1 Tax=Nycticebus coucang TaxID=9470 RepID=UPI00234D0E96|nr:UL16-binding protein 1-like [Nycticebus coucang]